MSMVTNLSNKLRGAPPVNNIQRPVRDVDADTLGIMDNIVKTSKERDALRETVQRTEAELAQAYMRIDFLEKNLREAEYKRDFYQRHSTSIYTQLNNMRMMIDDVLRKAKEEAFAPAVGVEVTNDGAADIAAKLAPETVTPER